MEKNNWMQSEQLLANNIGRDNGVKTHNSCKEFNLNLVALFNTS